MPKLHRLKHSHDIPRCSAWFVYASGKGPYTVDRYTCHRTRKAARAAAKQLCQKVPGAKRVYIGPDAKSYVGWTTVSCPTRKR